MPEAETLYSMGEGASHFAARPTPAFMLSHPAHLFALGFGSGLSRIAPGTAGTLWAWLTFWTSVFDTGESQKRRGFDSTVGVAGCGDNKRPEFVVYDRLLRQTFNRVHDPLTRRAVGEWSDSRRSHWTPLKLALQSRTPETLTRRTKGHLQRRGAKKSSPNWQTFSQR